MLKVAFTHDVDRVRKSYQYFTHSLRSITALNIKRFLYQFKSYSKRDSVYWNFENICKLEKSYNIRSTFFFLNESIKFNIFNVSTWQLALGRYDINEKKVSDIIKYLSNNGWEIGLHGSYLSYNNKELLEQEKDSLETIINKKVIGIRQHYLNLSEKTWKYQRDVGFKYDSSWGYTRQIGFKDNRYKPFKPFNDYFTVFPMVIMDGVYMNIAERKMEFNHIIDQCIQNDSILVINWHSNNFNEYEYPGYFKAYSEIIEICLKYKAEIKTLGQYYNNKNP